MCNLTALPPHRPAAKRHKCGTTTALKRPRTAKPAPPQRTIVSTIRYLCVPTCGIFSGAGTASSRLCPIFAVRTAPTWVIYHEILIILATCYLHNLSFPKFYLSLPFSPPAPAWQPFPFLKVQLGNQKSSWCASHSIGRTQSPKAGGAALSRPTALLFPGFSVDSRIDLNL